MNESCVEQKVISLLAFSSFRFDQLCLNKNNLHVWKWHQQNKRSLKRSVKWNGLNVEVSRWSSWKREPSTEPHWTEHLPVNLILNGSFLSEWLAALSGCCGCPCFQSESPQNWKRKKLQKKKKIKKSTSNCSYLCVDDWLKRETKQEALLFPETVFNRRVSTNI